MAKLELALMVGSESKEWLAGLESVVKRLEALEQKLPGIKTLKQAEAEFDAESDEEEDDDFAPKKATKKSASVSFDEDDDNDAEAASADDDDDEGFAEPTTKKAKKLTVEDVNDACKKRAAKIGGKEGRTEVLGILKKKFKTTSVSELKPEQYAAVIAAMGA